MSSLVDLITDGKKIKSALTKRSKTHEVKTISAVDSDSLAKKIFEEGKEGWKLLKKIKARSRGKKACKVSKELPLSNQLEDELWCIAAGMGFKELSDGYNFQIEDETKERQIDVFAKDDEVAIYIECTQTAIVQKKSVESLINKISQKRTKVFDKVK